MAKKIARKSVAKSVAKRIAPKQIIVKNATGDPDTVAEIIVQNKIDYTPRVSVIIPVYNVEQYLRECLDSVVNQTLREIEIICVDDGSTDNSMAILKEFAKKDHRITILHQENLHAGVARNAGLAVARGEYVHFLDSDDYIDYSFYFSLVSGLESYNADFAYCSWAIKTEDNTPSRNMGTTEIAFNGFHVFDNDKHLINGEVWNKVFRRSLIDKYSIFFPNSNYGEDVSFVMQYLFASTTCFGIKAPLHHYRLQPTSLMSSILNKKLDSYKAISHTLLFLNKYPKFKQANKFYYARLEGSLRWLGCLSGSPQEAMEYIKKFEKYVTDKTDMTDLPVNTLISKLKLKKYTDVFNALFPEFVEPSRAIEYYDLQRNSISYVTKSKWHKSFKNTVDIAFIMDSDYFLCSYIAITSMIHSKNNGSKYNLNIIHTNLSFRQMKLLTLLENEDIHVNIIGFNADKYSGIKNVYHISNTALIKFDIPNIFPDLDKILYIDGDILIQKDLSNLFNIDLKNNYIAATREMQASLWKYEKIIGSKYYVNSGVILFNLKQMRKDGVPQKMIDKKMNQPSNWKCMDQDVFNFICDGRIHFLDVSYNCTISIFIKRDWTIKEINKFYKTHYKSMEDLINTATILHFAGDYKPWIYDVKTGRLTEKYLNILNHSLMRYKSNEFKELKKVIKIERLLRYKNELMQWYTRTTGGSLNLNKPKTFNEKIQWSKIYDSTPEKTRLADKYLVRDWVAEKIGDKYLIPLLGAYDSFDEIDFEKLPNRFVIKCNHGSGWNIVVKDKRKLDLAVVKEKIDKWMATNFAFVAGCEMQYFNIPPKIIIEQYMDDGTGDLRDYKFTCFDGKPEFIWIDSERHTKHKRNLYDLQWRQLKCKVNLSYDTFPSPDKPECLDEMVELAKRLSAGFNYVRVDFYIINNRIYFGEMTFTSSSGTEIIWPSSFEKHLSKLFRLPKLAYDIETGEYFKLPRIKKPKKVKAERKKINIKPYLLFPYYMCVNLYLKYIKIPRATLRKNGKIGLKAYFGCRIKKLPNIKSDAFISLGSACRPAFWLKKSGLRTCSLPFDYMMNYSLELVIKTLQSNLLNWFTDFTEEKKTIGLNRVVKDNKTNMVSLHHFPTSQSVNEYLPIFNSIFNRRNNRFRRILSEYRNICFVMNRRDAVLDILKFIKKISDMYPQNKFTVINVRHETNNKDIYKYTLGKKCILYDIHYNDVHENGADPKTNSAFWLGNTAFWSKLVSNMHINPSVKNTNFDSGLDAYTKEIIAYINKLQERQSQLINQVAELKNAIGDTRAEIQQIANQNTKATKKKK